MACFGTSSLEALLSSTLLAQLVCSCSISAFFTVKTWQLVTSRFQGGSQPRSRGEVTNIKVLFEGNQILALYSGRPLALEAFAHQVSEKQPSKTYLSVVCEAAEGHPKLLLRKPSVALRAVRAALPSPSAAYCPAYTSAPTDGYTALHMINDPGQKSVAKLTWKISESILRFALKSSTESEAAGRKALQSTLIFSRTECI